MAALPCSPEQTEALGRGGAPCAFPSRWVGSMAATGPWLLARGPVPALTGRPSLQGLFVLLFHCVLNREVRKHLKGVLAGKKLHPDDSATTRATLLTVGGPQGPCVGPGVPVGVQTKR